MHRRESRAFYRKILLVGCDGAYGRDLCVSAYNRNEMRFRNVIGDPFANKPVHAKAEAAYRIAD